MNIKIGKIEKIEKIENFDMFRLCKPQPNRRAWHLNNFLGIMDIMGSIIVIRGRFQGLAELQEEIGDAIQHNHRCKNEHDSMKTNEKGG